MPTLRSVHRFFHKLVPAMLAGLGAVVYRTGQEIGWIPKDVVIFPFLVLLAWVLFLYWFFAGPRAVRLYNNAYKKWAKERRLMAYGLAIIIGSIIGGGTGAAWWKLFESHRKQMAKVKEKPLDDNSAQPHEAAKKTADPKQPPTGSGPDTEKPSPKASPARPVPSVKKPESTPTFMEKAEYRISIGSNSMQMMPGSKATLLAMDKNGGMGIGSSTVNENSLIVGSVENGKVLVDTKLYAGPGANPIEVTRNQFSLSNATWDRNFNDTAFEVVNEDDVPTLQIIYQTPYNVVIYGTFQSQAGGALYVTPKTTIFNPTSPPPPLKRMFKYPSRKYQGQELEAN